MSVGSNISFSFRGYSNNQHPNPPFLSQDLCYVSWVEAAGHSYAVSVQLALCIPTINYTAAHVHVQYRGLLAGKLYFFILQIRLLDSHKCTMCKTDKVLCHNGIKKLSLELFLNCRSLWSSEELFYQHIKCKQYRLLYFHLKYFWNFKLQLLILHWNVNIQVRSLQPQLYLLPNFLSALEFNLQHM